MREPRQAVPLAGTWTGFPADSLGMTVSVHVGRVDPGREDGGSQDGTVVQLRDRDGSAPMLATAGRDPLDRRRDNSYAAPF